MTEPTVRAAVFGLATRPERLQAANRLLDTLTPLNPLHVPDLDRIGCWPAARQAWETLLAESSEEWLVLFADDAIPCPHLADDLPHVLAHAPAPIVGIYNSRPTFTRYGSPWILCSGALWGIAVAFHRDTLTDFLAWERANIPPDYPHDDGRYALYAHHTGTPAAITIPGLVDHDLTLGSVMGHSNAIAGRTAASFATVRPRDLNWTPPETIPTAAPGFGPRSRRILHILRRTNG